MSTIQTVKDDLSGWKLNRCIFVCDAGMGSDANTQYLQRGGGHYIIGRKMKSGEADVEQALSQKGRYTEIAEELLAKQVIIGNGEKRKRLVVVKNIKEQKRHKQSRKEIIEYLESAITRINKGRKQSQSKEALALRAHRIYGKYMIESSDDTLSLTDIVLGYKQLYDVEHAFRTLKTTLDLLPNYHTKHDRIRCHIFVCFIALLLVRISENATGKSWERIRRELNRIYYGEFKVENKLVAQLTELTGAQKSIFPAMGIKPPSSVVDIRDS